MYDFHERIELNFQPLLIVTMKGVSFQTAYIRNLRGNFMLLSYVPYIPEADYMFRVEKSTNKVSPYHRCLV